MTVACTIETRAIITPLMKVRNVQLPFDSTVIGEMCIQFAVVPVHLAQHRQNETTEIESVIVHSYTTRTCRTALMSHANDFVNVQAHAHYASKVASNQLTTKLHSISPL